MSRTETHRFKVESKLDEITDILKLIVKRLYEKEYLEVKYPKKDQSKCQDS